LPTNKEKIRVKAHKTFFNKNTPFPNISLIDLLIKDNLKIKKRKLIFSRRIKE